MSLTPLTCSWVHWRVASRLMHGRKNNNKASCKSRGVYTRVLVCSGCYNEIPQTEWLTKNRNLFLTVLEGGKSKVKVPPAWWRSGDGPLPGSQLAPSHLVLRWRKAQESSLEPLSQGTNPIPESFSFMT